MKNIFDDFTHCYPISKTLQFSLIPIGKTEEHIKSAGIIEEDRVRSEIYEQVKPLIDRCHRNYIDNSFRSLRDNRRRLLFPVMMQADMPDIL